MAVRFDLARLEVIGQPSPLVENVMQSFAPNVFHNSGAGQFSVSDSGALIYAAGGLLPDPKNSLVWVDQNGMEQAIPSSPMPFAYPRLSPDGQRITYVTVGRELGKNFSIDRDIKKIKFGPWTFEWTANSSPASRACFLSSPDMAFRAPYAAMICPRMDSDFSWSRCNKGSLRLSPN